MGFLESIVGGFIPGVSGVVGMLASGAAARRKQQEMEQLITQMERDTNGDIFNLQRDSGRTLATASGRLSDALAAKGRGLNAAMGEAGVYNSSAVAGTLQNDSQAGNATLLDLALQGQSQEQQMRSRLREKLTGMRYDNASADRQQALADRAGYQQGLVNLGGQLAETWASDAMQRSRDAATRRANERIMSERPGLGPSPDLPGSIQVAPQRTPYSLPMGVVPFNPTRETEMPQVSMTSYTPRLRSGSTTLSSVTPRTRLQSALQTNTQRGLAQSGVNRNRINQPAMNGTVNQGRRLPGNRMTSRKKRL